MFYGVVIAIYYNDHNPAHFHAVYGEHEALVAIETLAVLEGMLPRRALGMVLEWAEVNREELREDWRLARDGLPLKPIAPLD